MPEKRMAAFYRENDEVTRQHINHNNNKKLIFIVSYVHTCHIFALKVIIWLIRSSLAVEVNFIGPAAKSSDFEALQKIMGRREKDGVAVLEKRT